MFYLFLFNVFNGWNIKRLSPPNNQNPLLYDCNKLGTLCSEKNCKPFVNHLKSLPTESIYDKKGKMKIELDPIIYQQDTKLLCVNHNLFDAREAMSGLISKGNSLDFVTITPKSNGAEWEINSMQLYHNEKKEIEQQKKESKGMIVISKHNPCTFARNPCNQNLKKCIKDKIRYPYYKIDVNIDKFDQISQCDDRGWIDGQQCTKIICSENAGLDDNNEAIPFNQPIPAIIQCQDNGNNKYKPHSIYYHASKHRWCLSKYSHIDKHDDNDENYMTLKDMLTKQVANEEHIEYILQHEYDKKVQSYWFWGDAIDALRDSDIIPLNKYQQIEEQGLTDWTLKFSKLSSSKHQKIFAKLRRCDYQSQQIEITPNCNDMTITPWDILQIAVLQDVIQSFDTQNIDTSMNEMINEEEEEEEEDNNTRSYMTITVIICPLMLLIMGGFYIVIN